MKTIFAQVADTPHIAWRNPVSQKRFTRLVGYGIKIVRPTYKTKTLIYQSKANLDEKIFLGKKSHIFRTQQLENAVRVGMGIENSTFHSGP